jgi:hypothetical protein
MAKKPQDTNPNAATNNQGGYTFNYDPNAPVAPENQGAATSGYSSSYYNPENKKSEYDKWVASFGDDYIGKEKKADWENQWNTRASNEQRRGGYAAGVPGFTFSGTPQEEAGFLGGLELAQTGYGENLFDIGKNIGEVRGTLQDRMRGAASDPIISALQGQKASAMANAQRQLAASGVKGGTATGAVGDIGRQQSAQTAAALSSLGRQSAMDVKNLEGNTLAGTMSMAQSGKGEQTQFPQSPNLFGLGDIASSVICTELFNQGIMPKEIYLKDCEYGKHVNSVAPHVIVGYHVWAKPIVKLMKKSKLFTKIVAYPAMKWAKQMAKEETSVIGFLAVTVGEYFCGVLGKIKLLGEKYGISKSCI